MLPMHRSVAFKLSRRHESLRSGPPARPPAKQSASPPFDWPAIHFCRHRLLSRIVLSGRRWTGHARCLDLGRPAARQPNHREAGAAGSSWDRNPWFPQVRSSSARRVCPHSSCAAAQRSRGLRLGQEPLISLGAVLPYGRRNSGIRLDFISCGIRVMLPRPRSVAFKL